MDPVVPLTVPYLYLSVILNEHLKRRQPLGTTPCSSSPHASVALVSARAETPPRCPDQRSTNCDVDGDASYQGPRQLGLAGARVGLIACCKTVGPSNRHCKYLFRFVTLRALVFRVSVRLQQGRSVLPSFTSKSNMVFNIWKLYGAPYTSQLYLLY